MRVSVIFFIQHHPCPSISTHALIHSTHTQLSNASAHKQAAVDSLQKESLGMIRTRAHTHTRTHLHVHTYTHIHIHTRLLHLHPHSTQLTTQPQQHIHAHHIHTYQSTNHIPHSLTRTPYIHLPRQINRHICAHAPITLESVSLTLFYTDLQVAQLHVQWEAGMCVFFFISHHMYSRAYSHTYSHNT